MSMDWEKTEPFGTCREVVEGLGPGQVRGFSDGSPHEGQAGETGETGGVQELTVWRRMKVRCCGKRISGPTAKIPPPLWSFSD